MGNVSPSRGFFMGLIDSVSLSKICINYRTERCGVMLVGQGQV